MLEQALFKRDGKFDLQSGPCYAYLENPSVELSGGRIRLRAHLSSRVGVEFDQDCVGIGLASWTVVSGAPVVRDGSVCIEDLQFDQIDTPRRWD